MTEESVAGSVTAKVKGKPWAGSPKDLYIPPDALEIFLDSFEGPLDLLLYLIKKQNLDICDIAIHSVTLQYVEYVELMQDLKLELAADYLLMAAMLAEIKSRSLLPRVPAVSELDTQVSDPRAELLRRLQEYERVRQAALDLDALPRVEREILTAQIAYQQVEREPAIPSLNELLDAFAGVLRRTALHQHHQVTAEALSVRDKMNQILNRLITQQFVEFHTLFSVAEGRLGVVVSFLAIMELLKDALIELVQNEAFSVIHVRSRVCG